MPERSRTVRAKVIEIAAGLLVGFVLFWAAMAGALVLSRVASGDAAWRQTLEVGR